MTDKEEYQVTPYNWSDYLVACLITVALLSSPNFLAGISIAMLIQFLTIFDCFRTAKIDLHLLRYKTILFEKDIKWGDVSRIRLCGSWLQKKNLRINLKNGKKIKIFVTEENIDFVLKISRENKIKFEDDGDLLKK